MNEFVSFKALRNSTAREHDSQGVHSPDGVLLVD
jgi:hypothetical protein